MTPDIVFGLLVLFGLFMVVHAIGVVEHHVKQSAETLIKIEGHLEQINNVLTLVEDNLSDMRRAVVDDADPF